MAASASAEFLRISDVDLSSVDRNKEVKPNELLTITFEVRNEGEDKIEDIEALVYFERNGKKMDDDSGDDLEFDFDLDYIKGGKDKTVEFSFNIPFDVQDGHVYEVVIEVEGKNSSGREKYEDTDRSESFEIIKDRHELLFYRLSISPVTISCDRTLHVDYDIRDIGEKDEDVNLSIINNMFNINMNEDFHLESDYDEDNKWEQSHIFEIPSTVRPGTYGLTINLYYDDGDEHQYNTTNIVVEECGGSSSGTADTGSTTNDSSSGTSTGSTTNDSSGTSEQVDVIYTQPVTASTVPAVPPQKSSSGIDTTVILIVAAVVMIMLLIIVLVVVLGRK